VLFGTEEHLTELYGNPVPACESSHLLSVISFFLRWLLKTDQNHVARIGCRCFVSCLLD
jgi:hypothetical protein